MSEPVQPTASAPTDIYDMAVVAEASRIGATCMTLSLETIDDDRSSSLLGVLPPV